MRPYVIPVLPWQKSAGVRATYHLCDEINRRGGRAVIWNPSPADYAKTPDWLDCPPAGSLPTSGHAERIVVATDAIESHDARTVRWYLGRPADSIVQPIPGPNDYVWASWFNPGLRQCWLGAIYDFSLFCPPFSTHVKRRGTAVYIGKGKPTAPVPADAFVITPQWPRSRQDMARLLRSVELVISFDPFSGLNEEATLCGCPVRIHNAEPWQVTDTLGYAWTDDRIEAARIEANSGAAYEAFRARSRAAAFDVDKFIGHTQGVWE